MQEQAIFMNVNLLEGGAKTGKWGEGALAYLGSGTAAFSQEAPAGPVDICGTV